ncbi:hypothetical protein [Bradyrhizobium sp.]|uniref:hypothetical protein n=1 Tax=Bradyrhizobium sp. TaxID=376 RepID=UPI003BAF2672
MEGGAPLRGRVSGGQGRERPFGFDVVDGRLVPNANEQAALQHGRGMQANGDSLRSIAFVWMSKFGLEKYDAKSVQRILAREDSAA